MNEYKDKDDIIYPHIYLISDPTEDVTEIGWYFSDECEQLNGPFNTFMETKLLLENYCKCLEANQ